LSSAAELRLSFWDKWTSWQVGSTAERQLCPGAAPLQSTAGLRALPAGSEGRGERQREVNGSLGLEDAESSLGEEIFSAIDTVSLCMKDNVFEFCEKIY